MAVYSLCLYVTTVTNGSIKEGYMLKVRALQLPNGGDTPGSKKRFFPAGRTPSEYFRQKRFSRT